MAHFKNIGYRVKNNKNKHWQPPTIVGVAVIAYQCRLAITSQQVSTHNAKIEHIYYIRVTTDKRIVFDSKVFIQLNYKGIPTVYVWQIGDA